MFVLVYALNLWYHVHMKRDQINPQPILCVLGFFIIVCSVAIVCTILQALASIISG